MNLQRDHPNLMIWILIGLSSFYLLLSLLLYIVLYKNNSKPNTEEEDFYTCVFWTGMSRILLNGLGIATLRLWRVWRTTFWVKAIHFVIHTFILIEIIVCDLDILFGDKFIFEATEKSDKFLWRIAMYSYIVMYALSLHSWIFRPGILPWTKAAYQGCHALLGFMVYLFFIIEYLGKLQRVYDFQTKPMDFMIEFILYMLLTAVLLFCHCVFYVVINPYFD